MILGDDQSSWLYLTPDSLKFTRFDAVELFVGHLNSNING